jgi:Na+-driven multidrug efflux pump
MYEYQGRLMNERVTAFYVPGLIATFSVTAGMFLDIVIVGQMLGSMAMGAVNLALPVTMVFNMVYMLFGTGGEILVSAAKGAGKKKEADQLFTLTMGTIFVIGLVMMIVGLAKTSELAAILSGGEPALVQLVISYLHIIFLGAPLLVCVTGMGYFVKVDALPKLSSFIMFMTSTVNVVSKIIYMGPLQMGIAGAAYGTITGYIVGLVLVMTYVLNRKKRTLDFVWLRPRDFLPLGNIIFTGLPSSLGQGLGAVTSFVINTVIITVAGTTGIVVSTVCSSLSIFISTFRFAATNTMVPLVGALFGEHDWWSMHQIALRITKIALILVGLCIVVVEAFPANLMHLLGVTEMEAVAMGIVALRIQVFSVALGVGTHLIMTYLQIVKRQGIAIAISVGNEVFSIMFIYILSAIFGEIGLWLYGVASNVLILALTYLVLQYIGKHSGGKYHGFFIHERVPAYVSGNSIYATTEQVQGFTQMIGEFFQQNKVSSAVADKAQQLIRVHAQSIAARIHDQKKTIDIMTIIWDGKVTIRLRDDGAIPTAEQVAAQASPEVDQRSVMGYNDTFIEIAI